MREGVLYLTNRFRNMRHHLASFFNFHYFMFKKLLEYNREQNCSSSQDCDYGFSEQLPNEILEKILENLMLSDRIRSSLVCKSWKSAIMSSAPGHEFPWLVLPQCQNFKNDKTLSFFSLSDGKVVDLKLPKPVQGGWFCGSSKGWLIMIKEQGLNSKMFLLNPISRALHQLPSLATIPCFQKYVEKKDWKLYGANFFFDQVLLSSSNINSDQCVVAATFNSRKDLGLCRPGDKTWSVFRPIDLEQEYGIGQLLFSSGKLYALIASKINKNMTVARTLRYEDRELELMMVYIHVDPLVDPLSEETENVREYNDHTVYLRDGVTPFLLESTNNEVLLILKLNDMFVSNKAFEDGEDDILEEDDDNDVEDINLDEEEDDILEEEGILEEEEEEEDILEGEDESTDIEEEYNLEGEDEDYDMEEGDDVNNEEDSDGDSELFGVHNDFDPSICARTSHFYIYKIDSKTDGSNVYTRVQSLGDQILFLAEDGSTFSLPSTDFEEYGKNCIYFASKGTCRFVIQKPYTSREIGTFYLDTGRIKRSFPSIDFSTRTRINWYIPSL